MAVQSVTPPEMVKVTIFSPLVENHIDEIIDKILALTKENWGDTPTKKKMSPKAIAVRDLLMQGQGTVWASSEIQLYASLFSAIVGENIVIPSDHIKYAAGMIIVPTMKLGYGVYPVDKPVLILTASGRAAQASGAIINSIHNKRQGLRLPTKLEAKKLILSLNKKSPDVLTAAFDFLGMDGDGFPY